MAEAEEEPCFSIMENAQHRGYSFVTRTKSRAFRLTSFEHFLHQFLELLASKENASTFPTGMVS